MALLTGQRQESGMIRDVDGRQVVAVDNSSGAGSGVAGVPQGAAQVTNSSGNVAAASAVATLPAAAGKFTYLSSFQVTAAGATAAAVVNATVVGVVGGTMTFTFAAPAGATAAAAPLIVSFPEPVASSAVNTAIVVTLPSLGTGNTNAAVSAQGFQA